MKILIIGAGKLGLAVAKILHSQGHHITTLSRTPKPVPDGVTHLCQDVHNLQADSLGAFDWVYVILTPSERSLAGYVHTYVESIRPIYQATYTTRLVYVSSTQVYGQDNGETLDHTATPNPIGEQGKILYAAELIWQSLMADKLIIVRPSGIVQKDIFKTANSHFATIAKTLDDSSPQFACDYWLNLVYQDSVIELLAALPSLAQPKSAYIASDICILRHQFYNQLRQLQGLSAIAVPTTLKVAGKKLIKTAI